jgi:hypothetical protein
MESLSVGKFVIGRCVKCKNVIWPPADLCPVCLSAEIEWVEPDRNGKLVECAESFLMDQPCIFGMVELNGGIKLLGRIRSNIQLKKGTPVRMVKCGVENNEPYYEFQPM